MIGLGLGLVRQAVRNASGQAWTPAQLFANGEQGVWYEPKPQYLYQDAAGTIPVVADGDPVGLMLDRSRGLELGPELVDLSIGPVGTAFVYRGSMTQVDEGYYSLAWNDNSFNSTATASVDGLLVIGKTYEVTIDIQTLPEGRIRATFSTGQGSGLTKNLGIMTEPGVYTYRVVPAADTLTINFEQLTTLGAEAIFKTSIKELPGNHATAATSIERPLYSNTPPLQVYDTVDDAMTVTLPPIAAATVATATPTGTVIDYPVDLSSGSYTITESHSGIIIREGELTADEQGKVTAYLNNLAGV